MPIGDPFFVPHPNLNHRDVFVEVLGVAGDQVAKRKVIWGALTGPERLELERLLARACEA